MKINNEVLFSFVNRCLELNNEIKALQARIKQTEKELVELKNKSTITTSDLIKLQNLIKEHIKSNEKMVELKKQISQMRNLAELVDALSESEQGGEDV